MQMNVAQKDDQCEDRTVPRSSNDRWSQGLVADHRGWPPSTVIEIRKEIRLSDQMTVEGSYPGRRGPGKKEEPGGEGLFSPLPPVGPQTLVCAVCCAVLRPHIRERIKTISPNCVVDCAEYPFALLRDTLRNRCPDIIHDISCLF